MAKEKLNKEKFKANLSGVSDKLEKSHSEILKKTTKKVIKPQTKPKVELAKEPPKIATVLEFTGKPDGVCHVLVSMKGIYSDFSVGQQIELK